MITTDDIRKVLRERPSLLRIRLADGDTALIPHPEFAWVPPTMKRNIMVADQHGHTRVANLSSVVTVDRGAPKHDHASEDNPASGAA